MSEESFDLLVTADIVYGWPGLLTHSCLVVRKTTIRKSGSSTRTSGAFG